MEEDKPKPKFEAALQQNMLIKEKWKIEKLIGIPFLFLKKRKRNIWRNLFRTGYSFWKRSCN
jgi:hypothetical protein